MDTTPICRAGITSQISAAIASGTANSYCNQTSPPPTVKPTNAGAPSKLLVEHCVAIVDAARLPLYIPRPAKK